MKLLKKAQAEGLGTWSTIGIVLLVLLALAIIVIFIWKLAKSWSLPF